MEGLTAKHGGPCFETCDCCCQQTYADFDRIASNELRADLKLKKLLAAKIGWYGDKTLDDTGVSGWRFRKASGLYFLWHKDDYCPAHDRYHMRCLYVGKGAFSSRLRHHWASKDTSEQQLIYFSYIPLENRIAKYVEQLVLDLYRLPLNARENKGKAKLCGHFTQHEVD